MSLTKLQIKEFLYRLADNEECQFNGHERRCGGSQFTYARKVLRLMKVSEQEQERLLELCKEYGGYCDCEILMNAAPKF